MIWTLSFLCRRCAGGGRGSPVTFSGQSVLLIGLLLLSILDVTDDMSSSRVQLWMGVFLVLLQYSRNRDPPPPPLQYSK